MHLIQSEREGSGSQEGQAIVEGARVIGRKDGLGSLKQYGPRVQSFIHLHDGDSGPQISRHNGSLNGSCPPVSGKQGGVDVDAPLGRKAEHIRRQDFSIGNYDKEIRF
jgi:hypothetical protein